MPTEVLADYVGRYVSERRGDTVEVRLEDGSLWLRFEDGGIQEMVPISETRFRATDVPAPLEFVSDAAGVVTHFAIQMGLEEERFLRER